MDVVLRAAAIYIVLLILLRLTTRRIMRSATPLDMAVIFLFGGLGVQPILGEDRSITSALLAAFTIASLHIGVSLAKPMFPILGSITEGTPVIVFTDGAFDKRRLRQLRVQEGDVIAEMRQNGVRTPEEVERVVVEHNGAITVLKRQGQAAND
jgi:uncharacterized membrane protein YcaP (DUF421 family)